MDRSRYLQEIEKEMIQYCHNTGRRPSFILMDNKTYGELQQFCQYHIYSSPDRSDNTIFGLKIYRTDDLPEGEVKIGGFKDD